MVALIAISSLAVDLGRVLMARSELQAAADAAARHGALMLGTGSPQGQVISSAVNAAGDNSADGQKVELQRSDVELGRWDADAGVFLPGQTPPDAVRVTARRTRAAGNAVPLIFAQVIGKSSFDVTVRSVGVWSARPMGIIGLDEIDMGSQALTDSFDSSAGAYSAATAGTHGHIQTNGDIDLSGSVTIKGDARPGQGKRVTTGPGVVIAGSTAPLSSRMSFPSVTAGTAATVNDNANVPAQYLSGGKLVLSGTDLVRLPGGTYYFTGLSASGGSALELQGPATIYVAGNVSLADGARTWGQRPTDLDIRVIGAGTVDIKTGGDVYAMIYAPEAAVQIGGSGQLFGSIIGRSLRVTAHGGIHFDESLAGRAGSVVSVK
jgi:hypothetical protein